MNKAKQSEFEFGEFIVLVIAVYIFGLGMWGCFHLSLQGDFWEVLGARIMCVVCAGALVFFLTGVVIFMVQGVWAFFRLIFRNKERRSF